MSDTYNNPVPEPKEEIENEHGKTVEKRCWCGEKVSNRGYASHARSCDEAQERVKSTQDEGSGNPDEDPDGKGEVNPDEDPDGKGGEGGEPEQLNVTPECPECGNELKTANDVAEHYQRRGAEETAQQVRQYDYVCIADECVDETLTVLNSDELEGGSDD